MFLLQHNQHEAPHGTAAPGYSWPGALAAASRPGASFTKGPSLSRDRRLGTNCSTQQKQENTS